MRGFVRASLAVLLSVAAACEKPSSNVDQPDLTQSSSADLTASTIDLATPTVDLTAAVEDLAAAADDLSTTADVDQSPAEDLLSPASTDLMPLPTFTITIETTGSGTVNGTGFDCGTTCSLDLPVGTTVTLNAAPDTDFTFDGWGGACSGTSTCVFVVTADATVSALFSQGDPVLLVTRTGAAGTVSSSPAGIDCGTDCDETYTLDEVVTLTATPAANTVFMGWTGACSSLEPCEIQMSKSQNVTALFALKQYPLLVTVDGAGTVTSNTGGIDCGPSCVASIADSTSVQLTANPEPGWIFNGWQTSGCSSGVCSFSMTGPRTVIARFKRDELLLKVTRTGTGAESAKVTANVPGFDCGTQCSSLQLRNTMITLKAEPEPDTVFAGWSTGCAGTDPPLGDCHVTMSNAWTIFATFIKYHKFTVYKEGAGSGVVGSNDGKINCGSTCVTTVQDQNGIVLNASPLPGSKFDGWGGPNCNGTGSCSVTMNQAKDVIAYFSIKTYTVAVNHAAGGTVRSDAGIDCGGDCSTIVPHGTVVQYQATPDPGYYFVKWGGLASDDPCYESSNPICTHTIVIDDFVAPLFQRRYWPLTVNKAGGGTGTVTTAPGGFTGPINCNAGCSTQTVDYPENDFVTLTASPTANHVFTGWSGGGCVGTDPCSIPITQATSVTATFEIQKRQLTVVKTGAGTGVVASTPAGIDCGSDCTELLPQSQSANVFLQVTPDPGFAVASWSIPACANFTGCSFAMSADRTVTVRIEPIVEPLTIVKAGNGTGTVYSQGISGISCGGDCSNDYSFNDNIQLAAVADVGSSFIGWGGGGCTGTNPNCTVTMDQAREVVAYFGNSGNVITVVKAGTGEGTVTGTSVGGNIINCGSDCSELVTNGTLVSLTATPAAGSEITSWSPGGCPGNGSACSVTVNAATTVTVTFTKSPFVLNVQKSGNGTVSGTGIDCGSDCVENYAPNTSVTLTATPAAGHRFLGWGGACSGTDTCQVLMSSTRDVQAIFAANSYSLLVTRSGSGSGSVASAPAGINCGALCTNTYPYGTVITLTATEANGSNFVGWTGAGCNGTDPCQITITGATTVDAEFSVDTASINVSIEGTGTGTVVSTPVGINCPGDCSQTYAFGTYVELAASASADSDFDGWTGAPGCGIWPTCVVFVDGNVAPKATFTQRQHTLTVLLDGLGRGKVTAAGINCGTEPGQTDCAEIIDENATRTLVATAELGSTFAGWSDPGCPGTGNCVVTMTQGKTVTALFALSTKTLTVTRAGSVNANISIYSLTPSTDGTLLTCGSACTKTYYDGTHVALLPSQVNLGADVFVGWSGGGCSGTGPCVVDLTSNTTVTATFATANFVFMTSTTHRGNLGGLSGADQICQDRANAAGLPGTYRAWLSSSTTSAASRLGSARGWVSPTGLPVLDRIADVASDNLIYPPFVDEQGANRTARAATATNKLGQFDAGAESSDCNGWTSSAPSAKRLVGAPTANSSLFTDAQQYVGCDVPQHLFCFGVDQTTPLAKPNRGSRKLAFTSSLEFNPATGLAAADLLCQSEASGAGLNGTFRALLATTGATPISRFADNPSGWQRIDGPLVASNSAELSFAFLASAPNTNAADSLHFGHEQTWSGSSAPNVGGVAGTTCNNWSSSSSSATAIIGIAGDAKQSTWRIAAQMVGCDVPRRVVCLQD